MTKEQKTGCWLALIALLISPITITLKGLVLTILWRWFVVPVTGLPALSIPMALGISLIAGYLTEQYIKQPKDDDEDQVHSLIVGIVKGFLSPAFALFFGWIYHSLVR
uniref:Uncharacterized protein n=1 Tax=viral metagenome TaxID=1070528 RepID=A0A6M3M4S4_9ZZZZ